MYWQGKGKKWVKGTGGKRAASGRFAEGESDPQVRGLTSVGRESAIRDDQTDRTMALAGFGAAPQSLMPQHDRVASEHPEGL